MSKLAIVGSAGRREDGAKITPELYSAMVTKAKDTIKVLNTEHQIRIDCLVSGGAALADHVAVTLFLQRFVAKLELYLPCEFNHTAGRFSLVDSRTTASIVDHYHRKFSNALKIDSLLQLKKVLEMHDCSAQIVPGFKERNTAIAVNADCLLAMTFGNGRLVKPGGTSDTVEKFLARPDHGMSFHMDLATNLCYRNARVAA